MSEGITQPLPDLRPINRHLQDVKNCTVTSNSVNLTFLKTAVALLPNAAKPTDKLEKVLDLVHAILFHTIFPLRKQVSKDWFEANYIPTKGPTLSQQEKEEGLDILSTLGLIKPAEPIKRRI